MEARGGGEHEQERANIFVGRGSFGQPPRLWRDAPDRRGDLGLAARSRECEEGSATIDNVAGTYEDQSSSPNDAS